MLYIGGGGFWPATPQTTFDQPKTLVHLFKTIDTKFDSQKIS